MQDKAGVDQKVSDAELTALVCKAQGEIQAHDGLNELNLLLRGSSQKIQYADIAALPD